jgi:excisionase family DNA binding protein
MTTLKTVQEAAAALGLSVHTIRAWIATRRIAHVRLGRAVRVLTCRISSDQSLLENGAHLRGPGFSDRNQSDSAAGSIIIRAYSLGLRPLRAR